MSPMNTETVIKMVGFPRVSGDEPAKAATSANGRTFSPRERG